MLKEKKKKLPSESGNNAAESFKFLNILTRQGRQLRMLRVLTRERTRKTHRTFYFRIFCSIHFVGYPVQIVQLYFGKTFRIAISWAAFCFARCRKSTGTWIAQEPGTNRRGTRSIFLVITRSRGILFPKHMLHYQLKLLQTLSPKGSQNKLSLWRIERKIAAMWGWEDHYVLNNSPELLTLNLFSL